MKTVRIRSLDDVAHPPRAAAMPVQHLERRSFLRRWWPWLAIAAGLGGAALDVTAVRHVLLEVRDIVVSIFLFCLGVAAIGALALFVRFVDWLLEFVPRPPPSSSSLQGPASRSRDDDDDDGHKPTPGDALDPRNLIYYDSDPINDPMEDLHDPFSSWND